MPALVVSLALAILGLVLFVRFSWRDAPDLLSPTTLVVIYLSIAYVLDPIYIAATRVYGFNDKYAYGLSFGELYELSYVVLLAILSLVGLAVGVVWQRRRRVPQRLLRLANLGRQRQLSPGRIIAVTTLALMLTLWALVTAFRAQAANWVDAIRWIGNKQALYEGRGYLLILVLAFKASVLIWSAELFAQSTRVERRAWVAWSCAVVATVLVDLSTGTRSNLLFSNLLVLVLLYHRLRRPLPARTVLQAVPLVIFALIAIRVLSRDIFFEQYRHLSAPELVFEKLRGVTHTVLFEEVQSADAQLLALESPQTPPSPLWGETLLAAVALPIPRALYPAKPRGGNALFTRLYYPTRYYSTRVEMTVSLLTELWLNGRVAAVVVGFAVLGWLLTLVQQLGMTRRSSLMECLYALVVWRFISLLRGDVFNWIVNVTSMAVLLTVCFVLMARASPKADW